MTGYYYMKGMFWFRIFGYGFHCKDTNIHPILFSERNGYTKHWYFCKWSMKFLKRERKCSKLFVK